jgi:hypothetical protein
MKMWDPGRGVYDEDILVPQMSWTPNVQYHMKWENKSDKGERGTSSIWHAHLGCKTLNEIALVRILNRGLGATGHTDRCHSSWIQVQG